MKHQVISHAVAPRLGLAAVMLSLLVCSSFAADEKAVAEKAEPAGAGAPPDMAEMMKKMEEISGPGPEHKVLTALAGVWDVEVKSWMGGPDGPSTTSKGIAKGKLILGGRGRYHATIGKDPEERGKDDDQKNPVEPTGRRARGRK